MEVLRALFLAVIGVAFAYAQASAAKPAPAKTPAAKAPSTAAKTEAAGNLVDINSASADELHGLCG
jgi:DNA uptake protein ComE-like DNA-binding protein